MKTNDDLMKELLTPEECAETDAEVTTKVARIRGGKRPGAGRPKGAKQKAPKKPKIEHETNFHVRCSYAQREKLKAYWQTIKHMPEDE